MPPKKDKAKQTAKKEAKQARASAKQSRSAAKAGRAMLGDDDVDSALSSRLAEAAKRKTTLVEPCGVPAPRVNGTLTAHPSKNELILMGGESFNGRDVETYHDLYFYNIAKNEWKQAHTVNPPPPRTSHQAVAVAQGSAPGSGTLYVFGGDFTSPAQLFRHYNDLWALDLATLQWEQIKVPNAPAPRSGHRMLFYKRKLFVFGGFFDSVQDIKYYDDLHVFDLDTRQWTKVKPATPSAPWPSARSGCGFALPGASDTAYLYGGYCSHVKNKKTMDEKQSVLSDLWTLNLTTLSWTKLKVSAGATAAAATAAAAAAPALRAGVALFSTRGGVYAFGGVRDPENEDDAAVAGAAAAVLTEPLFFNSLSVFQPKKRTWELVPLNTGRPPHSKEAGDAEEDEALTALGGRIGGKGAAVGKSKQRHGANDDEEEEEDGVLAALAKMKLGGGDSDASEGHALSSDDDNDDEEAASAGGVVGGGYVWPRRNAMICPAPSGAVFLFGGVIERGVTELSLNDLHRWDAKKGAKGGWKTLHEADIDKAEWFYDEADFGGDDGDDGDDDDDDDDEEDDEEAPAGKKRGRNYTKGERDASVFDDDDEEEDEDEDADEDEDEDEDEDDGEGSGDALTPVKGENLNIFFGRTKDHWVARAQEEADDGTSDKEIRKAAFALAAEHFQANK